MKFRFLVALLLLCSVHAFSQSKNSISLVYGISSTTVDTHNAIGDNGYTDKSGTQFGALYTIQLVKFLSIETGLMYANDKTALTYIIPGHGEGMQQGNIQLLSVPVYAKFTFLKYLFANAGFSVDKQTNYHINPILDDQSGIGAEVGVGGQYDFSHLRVFVNPFIRGHAIYSDRHNDQLTEQGVRFGVGYLF